MKKVKKLSLLLLSGVLCIAMSGCAGGNSAQPDNQESVKAELADAINQYNSMTFEHYVDTIEVSDPSILTSNVRSVYGSTFKSITWEDKTIYEITKTNSIATDEKVLKYTETIKTTAADGSVQSEERFYPGDGKLYINSNDVKFQAPFQEEPYSFELEVLHIDNLRNITSTVEGSKKIFKFNYNLEKYIAYDELDDFVRADSAVSLMDFSGSLIVDSSTGIITYNVNIEYKDKNSGATLKNTISSECSNVDPDLTFPSDLSSYSEGFLRVV